MPRLLPLSYLVRFEILIIHNGTSVKEARDNLKDDLVTLRSFGQIFLVNVKEINVAKAEAAIFSGDSSNHMYHFTFRISAQGQTRTNTYLPHAVIYFCDINKFKILSQQSYLVVEGDEAG